MKSFIECINGLYSRNNNKGEEMNNKKMLVIGILLIGAITWTACAGGQTATAAEVEEAAEQVVEEPAAEEQTAEEPAAEVEYVDGIPVYGCLGTAEEALVDLDCQEITFAVENAYLPFNYISSETGLAGGWDYDVMHEVCTRLHCAPVFQECSWDIMIQSVADGLYDVAGDGITINDEREQIVDFSIGYMNIQQRLLVQTGEDRFTSIEEFAALPDLTMGTQVGTTNLETALQYLPEERVKAFEQYPFAVQALIAGEVDTVILDEVIGLGYSGEFVVTSLDSHFRMAVNWLSHSTQRSNL
jgi:polar amino acid transport system substrate-binding protein